MLGVSFDAVQSLTDFINDKITFVFDTVEDMENSMYLKDGIMVQTRGFYEVDDGGGCKYRIRDFRSSGSNQDFTPNISHGFSIYCQKRPGTSYYNYVAEMIKDEFFYDVRKLGLFSVDDARKSEYSYSTIRDILWDACANGKIIYIQDEELVKYFDSRREFYYENMNHTVPFHRARLFYKGEFYGETYPCLDNLFHWEAHPGCIKTYYDGSDYYTYLDELDIRSSLLTDRSFVTVYDVPGTSDNLGNGASQSTCIKIPGKYFVSRTLSTSGERTEIVITVLSSAGTYLSPTWPRFVVFPIYDVARYGFASGDLHEDIKIIIDSQEYTMKPIPVSNNGTTVNGTVYYDGRTLDYSSEEIRNNVYNLKEHKATIILPNTISVAAVGVCGDFTSSYKSNKLSIYRISIDTVRRIKNYSENWITNPPIYTHIVEGGNILTHRKEQPDFDTLEIDLSDSSKYIYSNSEYGDIIKCSGPSSSNQQTIGYTYVDPNHGTVSLMPVEEEEEPSDPPCWRRFEIPYTDIAISEE